MGTRLLRKKGCISQPPLQVEWLVSEVKAEVWCNDFRNAPLKGRGTLLLDFLPPAGRNANEKPMLKCEDYLGPQNGGRSVWGHSGEAGGSQASDDHGAAKLVLKCPPHRRSI